ncbi:hypothetical protein [Hymenobacter arizonensis]|nr:hypothetical protein [Hymenobacter arizonensis]
MFLISAGPAAAQAPDPARLLTQHDYLLQSTKQRRTANVMLVMGGSVAVTAALGIASTFQNSSVNPSYLVWERVMIGGLGVAAVSLPLYVAARHNRQRAASLGLRLEVIPGPALATAIPAAGLRLSF